ncbi:hypothetical protein D3C87_1801750 [compost metagenome]
MPLSSKALSTSLRVDTAISLISFSNWARVISRSILYGAPLKKAKKGSSNLAEGAPDSIFFTFSASIFNRFLRTNISVFVPSVSRSIPSICLIFNRTQSTMALSKSAPPKWLFPALAFTSNIPSNISTTDTSKVPPPRS